MVAAACDSCCMLVGCYPCLTSNALCRVLPSAVLDGQVYMRLSLVNVTIIISSSSSSSIAIIIIIIITIAIIITTTNTARWLSVHSSLTLSVRYYKLL